jgi:hypothetical protein
MEDCTTSWSVKSPTVPLADAPRSTLLPLSVRRDVGVRSTVVPVFSMTKLPVVDQVTLIGIPFPRGENEIRDSGGVDRKLRAGLRGCERLVGYHALAFLDREAGQSVDHNIGHERLRCLRRSTASDTHESFASDCREADKRRGAVGVELGDRCGGPGVRRTGRAQPCSADNDEDGSQSCRPAADECAFVASFIVIAER